MNAITERVMTLARKPLAIRSAWGLVFRVSRLGLMFFASLILARLMTLKDYGTYQFVMSMATLLLIPSLFGLNRLLVREIAANQTKGHPELARGVMKFAISGVFLMACTVAGLVALSVTGLESRGPFEFTIPWFDGAAYTFSFAITSLDGAVYFGLVVLILLAMTQVFQGGAQGFHHTTTGQLPELVINPIAMLSIVSIGWLAGIPLTAGLALTYQIAAATIGATAGLIFLVRAIAPEVKKAVSKSTPKPWIMGALSFVFINGMYTINTQADVFMLGIIKGTEFSGLYYPASRYSQLVNLGLLAVYIPLSPIISSLYTKNDIKGVERTARFAAYLGLLCALPAAVLFWMWGPFFLNLFGAEYIAANAALSILCFGQIFTASMGPSVNSLTMTGFSRQASIGLLSGAILNVALNAILIPFFDVRGAAIATTCSTIMWNVVCIYYIVRLLNINPTAFGPSLRKRMKDQTDNKPGEEEAIAKPEV